MKNNQQQNLQRAHAAARQFIALAGMIGTGIFKGSADTLNIAGPSVIVAYLIGGLLLFIIMAALGNGARISKLKRSAFSEQSIWIPSFLSHRMAILD